MSSATSDDCVGVPLPMPSSSSSPPPPLPVLNISIGLLGHVDSGKTSLAKALSQVLSVAAIDRIPQSQTRGITIELGFSAFFMTIPDDSPLSRLYSSVQYTLVDCPGHASLIRTMLGGAAIIDCMCLVIDATKGMQTQTAECLVIGEILTDRMIVVLNKVDLLTDAAIQVPKIIQKLRTQVFAHTKFGKEVTIVTVTANPGSRDDLKIPPNGGSAAHQPDTHQDDAISHPLPDVSNLLSALRSNLFAPPRLHSSASDPFLFAVDHCFPLKGQGSVLTGTILSGQVEVGQNVEIPAMAIQRKVKSMQMFKKPVQKAVQGDR